MQWASNQGNEELTVNLGHINQDPLLSVTETATFSATRFIYHTRANIKTILFLHYPFFF